LNQRIDQTPDPANGAAHEALLEIAAHQLEEQAATLYQIP
jgi:hypothetical protein